jgi:hypothetical protein
MSFRGRCSTCRQEYPTDAEVRIALVEVSGSQYCYHCVSRCGRSLLLVGHDDLGLSTFVGRMGPVRHIRLIEEMARGPQM